MERLQSLRKSMINIKKKIDKCLFEWIIYILKLFFVIKSHKIATRRKRELKKGNNHYYCICHTC
jgi:hypothetical protein